MIQPTLPSTVLIIVIVMILFVTIPRPAAPRHLYPRLVVALPTIDNGEGVFIPVGENPHEVLGLPLGSFLGILGLIIPFLGFVLWFFQPCYAEWAKSRWEAWQRRGQGGAPPDEQLEMSPVPAARTNHEDMAASGTLTEVLVVNDATTPAVRDGYPAGCSNVPDRLHIHAEAKSVSSGAKLTQPEHVNP